MLSASFLALKGKSRSSREKDERLFRSLPSTVLTVSGSKGLPIGTLSRFHRATHAKAAPLLSSDKLLLATSRIGIAHNVVLEEVHAFLRKPILVH